MMLPAHTAQAPGEECGSMMQAAELAVLDWLQAHLRCDFLDAVMPWISRICDHGEIWILLAAVLLLCLALIPGASLWGMLHNLILGMFGLCAYILPVLL